MAHHRRFPGGFLVLIAVLTVPSVLYGLVSAAENADKCESVTKHPKLAEQLKQQGLKCEVH